MRILVGSTIPAFKMTDDGDWWWWVHNAQRIAREAARAGHEVDWLAVCQHDARGREPFKPLLKRLSLLKRTHVRWFSMDDGDDLITGQNRLAAICTGRNLITEHGIRHKHHAIYFADSDTSAPDDILVKLLELDWPVCSATIPTYGFLDGLPARDWRTDGTRNDDPLQAAQYAAATDQERDERIRRAGAIGDVRVHWNTAGSLLLTREAFRRVPWRYDLDTGETDDPATQSELARLGWPTLVRHDVICTHHPQTIWPLEQRGHDLKVYR